MLPRPSMLRCALVVAVVVGLCAGLALAGSHTWRVNEIFSNASGTIQFIELKECCGGNFEQGVNGHNLTSNSRSYLIPGSPLPPTTALRTLLFATPQFAALPGVPTPDYVIPAGSVPFFSVSGDSISYVPWDTMTFGAGQLPTDGIHSRNAGGVIACNTPTNYAGVTATINLGCSLRGDVDGSGTVDGGDIAGFIRILLGAPQAGDNAACAEFCAGTVAGNVAAFVSRLLS